LSEDNVLDGGDELIGQEEVGNLKNGKHRMVMVPYELQDAEPGQAYLIVKIDSEDDVSETNENNNTQPEKINVKE
jgi:subtilase family serine protease